MIKPRRSLAAPMPRAVAMATSAKVNSSDDAFVRQEPTRQHLRRVADLQIEDARRDRLHEDGQIGVLEEQRVAADVVAVHLAQQSVPQVAL